jgi:hypothetical protein
VSPVASFVIYYHSSRMDNLEQTLRFLSKREADLLSKSELVLVCHDCSEPPKNIFAHVQHVNMGMEVYNKPLMNNRGVEAAQSEVIVLLDSDRILTPNYFTNAVSKVQPGECISTIWLYKLRRATTDHHIERLGCCMDNDFRSKDNEMHRKNMFSGNTVMRRDDYLAAGGMDESFESYGYNDNDFTMTMTRRGARFTWLDNVMELHLHHPPGPGIVGTGMIESNVRNGIRYCNKWGLLPGEILKARAALIGVDVGQHVRKLKTRKTLT